MAKKKTDWTKWAMWGGAAALAYIIFKPKTAAASDIVLAKKAAAQQWRSRLASTNAPRYVEDDEGCYDLVADEAASADMCQAQMTADPFDLHFYPPES